MRAVGILVQAVSVICAGFLTGILLGRFVPLAPSPGPASPPSTVARTQVTSPLPRATRPPRPVPSNPTTTPLPLPSETAPASPIAPVPDLWSTAPSPSPTTPRRPPPPPTLSPSCLKKLLEHHDVIRYGSSKGRYVALTLDDGPSLDTPQTLEILRKAGIHATFFVIGKQVDDPTLHPYVVRMREEGHEVENHTYSHGLGPRFHTVRFATASPRQQEEELRSADRALSFPSHFLRVPGGLFPGDRVGQTIQVARDCGKVIVNWDVDGDTPGPDRIHHGRIDDKKPEDILAHYVSRVQPGSIVLMHPEHREDAPYTLEILGQFIAAMQKRHYEFVTLEELMMGRGPRVVAQRP